MNRFLKLITLCATAWLAPAVSHAAPASSAPYKASTVETLYVDAGAVRYAYRELGPKDGVPLLLINRLRGALDDWDPALLDLLASERRVILFDNVGMAQSSGTTPTTLPGFAEGAAAFLRALGLKQVDLLGYSFGGMVAQQLALDQPQRVRRVILAGSGPGYVENASTADKVWQVAGKPVNVPEDFLYLFFKDTTTSQAAGKAYFARMAQRRNAHATPVSAESWKAQLSAAGGVSTPQTTLLNRLGTLSQPVLVANGDQDIMIPTKASWAMFTALPNAKLVIYPDSGHGFLFQYADEFGREVLQFLRN